MMIVGCQFAISDHLWRPKHCDYKWLKSRFTRV